MAELGAFFLGDCFYWRTLYIGGFLNIFIHQHMLIATNENKQRNNLN